MKVVQRIIHAVLACVVVSAVLIGADALAGLTGEQADALQAKVAAGDKTALDTLRAEAGKGDQYAQFTLGVCYEDGKGVSQDYNQAAQWYRKAADQGYNGAQNNLGKLYANGQGVLQDYARAVQWYRKAADQGNASAQYNLGLRYENGQGVLQDYAQAAQWYRKAADQGHNGAQNNLGVLYTDGHGVPQDYARAVQWYRKAAEQGNTNAQYNLGQHYKEGQGVLQDYAQAAQWFRKAADQGNADALNNLGVFYSKGQGVPQNSVAAYALCNLSATIDSSSANHAVNNRSSLADGMTNQEIEAGQTLAREFISRNNLTALDEYLAQPAAKGKQRRAAAATPARPEGRYPAQPAKKPGVVSCNTRCVNGDCYRTYDNGQRVHFQAPLKWDALSNQMKFDSGPCA